MNTDAIRAAHDAAVELGANCEPGCMFHTPADAHSKGFLHARARALGLSLALTNAQRN